jgi:hypothetical protein
MRTNMNIADKLVRVTIALSELTLISQTLFLEL